MFSEPAEDSLRGVLHRPTAADVSHEEIKANNVTEGNNGKKKRIINDFWSLSAFFFLYLSWFVTNQNLETTP